MGAIYTIGHSTRAFGEFAALLEEYAVKSVADVRSMPASRRYPQFNIETLPGSLGDAGIGYQHIAELGGRRRRPPGSAASPNTLWRNDSFRNYADYAMTEPFRIGMARLRLIADQSTCAIMCSEAVWWRCHRRIISDYLLTQGFDVRHIMGGHRVEQAKLTAGAEQLPEGTLVYPGSGDLSDEVPPDG